MASLEHPRAFIGNHHPTHRAFGLTSNANCASENFGSPPCALTATEHLRMLTGLLGVHRALRNPPEHLRVFTGNLRH